MQCVSCHFENMPGTRSCVRCGTSLGLSTAVLTVTPPRASPLSKALRKWLPMRRGYYVLREAVAGWNLSRLASALVRPVETGDLSLPQLLRMTIPGWAHVYEGHRARGVCFAISYWSLLAFAIVTFGSANAAIALGLAFGVHAASVIDLCMDSMESALGRWIGMPLVVMLSLTLYYTFAGSAVAQFASVRRLVHDMPPFTAGDVLAFRPPGIAYRAVLPNDVVLYRVPRRPGGFRVPAATLNAGREATVLQLEGERVDRVIAGPNSSIRWEKGLLRINGEPSPLKPLNASKLPISLNFDVPEGHYAILLTTDALLNPEMPIAVWQFVCCVPADHIVGKVFVRNYPLSRWSWTF
jgi:hypothetical protein